MASYYVGIIAQPDGCYNVHRSDCKYLPPPDRRIYLGDFPDCLEAINEARLAYHNAKRCEICLPAKENK